MPAERRPLPQEARAAWMLLAPGLAAILVLFLVPIAAAFLLSLTDFDIYALGSLDTVRFVGLRNYASLLRDPLLWKAMRNTALFLFVGGPLTLGVQYVDTDGTFITPITGRNASGAGVVGSVGVAF